MKSKKQASKINIDQGFRRLGMFIENIDIVKRDIEIMKTDIEFLKRKWSCAVVSLVLLSGFAIFQEYCAYDINS